MENILIIDDEEYLRNELGHILEQPQRQIFYASNGLEGLDVLNNNDIDIVLTDLKMPKLDGFGFIEKAKAIEPSLPIITITAYASTEVAIRALRLGAYDFITKPFSIDEVQNIVAHALLAQKLFEEVHYLRSRLNKQYSMDNIIGQSIPMEKLFDTVSRVADKPCNVLLIVESGTGKDLVAQSIHHHSKRKDRRFVPINCGSIPEGLLESELFGHVKGAFTGAVSNKDGLVDAANGGTLFLDEIGDMPLSLQVRLLRLIQNRQIQKVGSTQTQNVDVRIIAATNQDLAANIMNGTFRKDLYYRINVVEIFLPPLREREGDINFLALHFLKNYSSLLNKDVSEISPEVLKIFQRYDWPGNVRELENAIERAITMCQGPRIEVSDIPRVIVDSVNQNPEMVGTLTERIDKFEARCIESTIKANDYNLEIAANELGVSIATLYRKIKKYNIFLKRNPASEINGLEFKHFKQYSTNRY